MRMQMFYASDEEFHRLFLNLKLTPCPRCKCTGTLILHGKLYGYADSDPHMKSARGRRIFCNSRKKNRAGCGHSFTVWAADKLKYACLGATNLWRFLKNVVQSSNKALALRNLNLSLGPSSAYRIWNRFSKGLSRVRTFLIQLCPPPAMPETESPAIQTIAHLEAAFDNDPCPIIAFQKRFQASFL